MAEWANRRAAERMPVTSGAGCPVTTAAGEDLGLATIRDVSLCGVGLLLAHRVEAEAVLSVVLSNPAKGFAKPVAVRVAHVTPTAGRFLVGGTFAAPLTFEELDALMV